MAYKAARYSILAVQDREENTAIELLPPNEENLLWPNWVDYLKGKQRCNFVAQGTLINKHSIPGYYSELNTLQQLEEKLEEGA